jgi:hypothetical protein
LVPHAGRTTESLDDELMQLQHLVDSQIANHDNRRYSSAFFSRT